MPLAAIIGRLKWFAGAAEVFSYAMDQQVTIISELQPPTKRLASRRSLARYGAINMSYRALLNLARDYIMFGLVITLVLALAVGAGSYDPPPGLYISG